MVSPLIGSSFAFSYSCFFYCSSFVFYYPASPACFVARFTACIFAAFSFRAVWCLCLPASWLVFAACVPVPAWFVRLAPFGLPDCIFVACSFRAVWCLFLLRGFYCRCSACTSWFARSRAVSCWYLLRGSFLLLACL